MEFSTHFPLALPVATAIERLQDPAALKRALPGRVVLEPLSDTETAFTVERTLKRLKIAVKLKGHAKYFRDPEGRGLTLIVDAGNRLSGRMRLRLDLRGHDMPQGRILGLRAKVEGSGLLGGLMRDHRAETEARLVDLVQTMLGKEPAEGDGRA